MFLICLFEVSAWPLVGGWYGVATLCHIPWACRYEWNFLSMKCVPPSLITILGVPNLGNITSSKIFFECLELAFLDGMASTPLGYIVNCHQNVLIIPWFHKWSHVINSPDVKEFYLKIDGEWHNISSNDISVPLTWPTSLDEIFGVFIHGWPEETTLPNFAWVRNTP